MNTGHYSPSGQPLNPHDPPEPGEEILAIEDAVLDHEAGLLHPEEA